MSVRGKWFMVKAHPRYRGVYGQYQWARYWDGDVVVSDGKGGRRSFPGEVAYDKFEIVLTERGVVHPDVATLESL